MPLVRITPDLEMSYRDDTFADTWRMPEPMLLLHGNAESGEAWNAWLPVLGRRFRVVRPDMRGFGRSTPMPLDYRWSIDRIIEDFIALTDALGLQAFHIGAAKIACPIALRLAARHPARVRSLVVLGGLVSGEASVGDRAASWLDHIEKHGVESWARWTMPVARQHLRRRDDGRLGPAHGPDAALDPNGLHPLGAGHRRAAGPAGDQVPDARCHDGRHRPRLGGLDPRLAEGDFRLGIHGRAGRFLSCRRDAPRACAKAMVDFIERRNLMQYRA